MCNDKSSTRFYAFLIPLFPLHINLRSIIYYTWLICIHTFSLSAALFLHKIIVLETIAKWKSIVSSECFCCVANDEGKTYCCQYFSFMSSNGPYFFAAFIDRRNGCGVRLKKWFFPFSHIFLCSNHWWRILIALSHISDDIIWKFIPLGNFNS